MNEYELVHGTQHGIASVGKFQASSTEEAIYKAGELLKLRYGDFCEYDGTNARLFRKEEIWIGKLGELRNENMPRSSTG